MGAAIAANEQYVYGSSRLGSINRNLAISSSLNIEGNIIPGIGNAYNDEMLRGKKQYELSNHLGNVLATISDKKKYNMGGYYEADIVSASDYYPFGMSMPGRNISSGSYRYGYNGKEKLAEYNSDNYDFGARIYDSRIGRWLSIDPLQKKYPGETPYLYTGGNPILFKDPDGRDRIVTTTTTYELGGGTVFR